MLNFGRVFRGYDSASDQEDNFDPLLGDNPDVDEEQKEYMDIDRAQLVTGQHIQQDVRDTDIARELQPIRQQYEKLKKEEKERERIEEEARQNTGWRRLVNNYRNLGTTSKRLLKGGVLGGLGLGAYNLVKEGQQDQAWYEKAWGGFVNLFYPHDKGGSLTNNLIGFIGKLAWSPYDLLGGSFLGGSLLSYGLGMGLDIFVSSVMLPFNVLGGIDPAGEVVGNKAMGGIRPFKDLSAQTSKLFNPMVSGVFGLATGVLSAGKDAVAELYRTIKEQMTKVSAQLSSVSEEVLRNEQEALFMVSFIISAAQYEEILIQQDTLQHNSDMLVHVAMNSEDMTQDRIDALREITEQQLSDLTVAIEEYPYTTEELQVIEDMSARLANIIGMRAQLKQQQLPEDQLQAGEERLAELQTQSQLLTDELYSKYKGFEATQLAEQFAKMAGMLLVIQNFQEEANRAIQEFLINPDAKTGVVKKIDLFNMKSDNRIREQQEKRLAQTTFNLFKSKGPEAVKSGLLQATLLKNQLNSLATPENKRYATKISDKLAKTLFYRDTVNRMVVDPEIGEESRFVFLLDKYMSQENTKGVTNDMLMTAIQHQGARIMRRYLEDDPNFKDGEQMTFKKSYEAFVGSIEGIRKKLDAKKKDFGLTTYDVKYVNNLLDMLYEDISTNATKLVRERVRIPHLDLRFTPIETAFEKAKPAQNMFLKLKDTLVEYAPIPRVYKGDPNAIKSALKRRKSFKNLAIIEDNEEREQKQIEDRKVEQNQDYNDFKQRYITYEQGWKDIDTAQKEENKNFKESISRLDKLSRLMYDDQYRDGPWGVGTLIVGASSIPREVKAALARHNIHVGGDPKEDRKLEDAANAIEEDALKTRQELRDLQGQITVKARMDKMKKKDIYETQQMITEKISKANSIHEKIKALEDAIGNDYVQLVRGSTAWQDQTFVNWYNTIRNRGKDSKVFAMQALTPHMLGIYDSMFDKMSEKTYGFDASRVGRFAPELFDLGESYNRFAGYAIHSNPTQEQANALNPLVETVARIQEAIEADITAKQQQYQQQVRRQNVGEGQQNVAEGRQNRNLFDLGDEEEAKEEIIPLARGDVIRQVKDDKKQEFRDTSERKQRIDQKIMELKKSLGEWAPISLQDNILKKVISDGTNYILSTQQKLQMLKYGQGLRGRTKLELADEQDADVQDKQNFMLNQLTSFQAIYDQRKKNSSLLLNDNVVGENVLDTDEQILDAFVTGRKVTKSDADKINKTITDFKKAQNELMVPTNESNRPFLMSNYAIASKEMLKSLLHLSFGLKIDNDDPQMKKALENGLESIFERFKRGRVDMDGLNVDDFKRLALFRKEDIGVGTMDPNSSDDQKEKARKVLNMIDNVEDLIAGSAADDDPNMQATIQRNVVAITGMYKDIVRKPLKERTPQENNIVQQLTRIYHPKLQQNMEMFAHVLGSVLPTPDQQKEQVEEFKKMVVNQPKVTSWVQGQLKGYKQDRLFNLLKTGDSKGKGASPDAQGIVSGKGLDQTFKHLNDNLLKSMSSAIAEKFGKQIGVNLNKFMTSISPIDMVRASMLGDEGSTKLIQQQMRIPKELFEQKANDPAYSSLHNMSLEENKNAIEMAVLGDTRQQFEEDLANERNGGAAARDRQRSHTSTYKELQKAKYQNSILYLGQDTQLGKRKPIDSIYQLEKRFSMLDQGEANYRQKAAKIGAEVQRIETKLETENRLIQDAIGRTNPNQIEMQINKLQSAKSGRQMLKGMMSAFANAQTHFEYHMNSGRLPDPAVLVNLQSIASTASIMTDRFSEEGNAYPEYGFGQNDLDRTTMIQAMKRFKDITAKYFDKAMLHVNDIGETNLKALHQLSDKIGDDMFKQEQNVVQPLKKQLQNLIFEIANKSGVRTKDMANNTGYWRGQTGSAPTPSLLQQLGKTPAGRSTSIPFPTLQSRINQTIPSLIPGQSDQYGQQQQQQHQHPQQQQQQERRAVQLQSNQVQQFDPSFQELAHAKKSHVHSDENLRLLNSLRFSKSLQRLVKYDPKTNEYSELTENEKEEVAQGIAELILYLFARFTQEAIEDNLASKLKESLKDVLVYDKPQFSGMFNVINEITKQFKNYKKSDKPLVDKLIRKLLSEAPNDKQLSRFGDKGAQREQTANQDQMQREDM